MSARSREQSSGTKKVTNKVQQKRSGPVTTRLTTQYTTGFS